MPSVYTKGYRNFLHKLKTARLEAKLTQVQAAKKLGKPQSFVSKCEAGERRVDIAEVQLFARLYGKPVSFFHDGK